MPVQGQLLWRAPTHVYSARPGLRQLSVLSRQSEGREGDRSCSKLLSARSRDVPQLNQYAQVAPFKPERERSRARASSTKSESPSYMFLPPPRFAIFVCARSQIVLSWWCFSMDVTLLPNGTRNLGSYRKYPRMIQVSSQCTDALMADTQEYFFFKATLRI